MLFFPVYIEFHPGTLVSLQFPGRCFSPHRPLSTGLPRLPQLTSYANGGNEVREPEDAEGHARVLGCWPQ